MIEYHIYEIIGHKVGCTKNIEERMKINAKKYNVGINDYKVLEIHTDIDKAAIREKELSIEKGYGWDGSDYRKMVALSKKYRHLTTTKEATKKRLESTDYSKIIETKKKRGWPGIAKKVIAYTCDIKRFGKYNNRKKIVNKKYYKTYKTLTDCAKDLNLRVPIVTMIANPDTDNLQTKGYTFRYA